LTVSRADELVCDRRYGEAARQGKKARALPAEDQDAVAIAMLAMTEELPVVAVDNDARAAIREGLEQARRGEFVPDAEIEALWRRHGL
jgi:predicted transcriptional regulator